MKRRYHALVAYIGKEVIWPEDRASGTFAKPSPAIVQIRNYHKEQCRQDDVYYGWCLGVIAYRETRERFVIEERSHHCKGRPLFPPIADESKGIQIRMAVWHQVRYCPAPVGR